MMIPVQSVCVIGLGLIGGSVLRAAVRAGRAAWGVTTSSADAKAAADAGYHVVAELTEALELAREKDAIVVIAVPLPEVGGVVRAIATAAPRCLVTDVVSVKAPVAETVRRHGPWLRYVGGHPMAGSAESGWAASTESLFHGAAWVVATELDSDPVAWRAVVELVLDCGAEVVPTTASAHDDAVARISHLPHVLAAVLAATGADGGPLAMALAAGSFRDGTRVAGTRPELVLAMCEGNRASLLDAVDDALGKLGTARGALASTGSLGATVRAGHAGHAALAEHQAAPRTDVRVDLTKPDAFDRLRELGETGARLTDLDGDTAIVRTLA
jgi:prephenate dehydrogenase